MTRSKMFFFRKDEVVLEKVTKKLVLTGYTHVNSTVSMWRRTYFISFKRAVCFTENMEPENLLESSSECLHNMWVCLVQS